MQVAATQDTYYARHLRFNITPGAATFTSRVRRIRAASERLAILDKGCCTQASIDSSPVLLPSSCKLNAAMLRAEQVRMRPHQASRQAGGRARKQAGHNTMLRGKCSKEEELKTGQC